VTEKEGQGVSPALHHIVVRQQALAKLYTGVGKGLKPDIDSAIAVVVAVAAIAVAVMAVPADMRIGQVGGTINGLKRGM
jgi:hypothetical protein